MRPSWRITVSAMGPGAVNGLWPQPGKTAGAFQLWYDLGAQTTVGTTVGWFSPAGMAPGLGGSRAGLGSQMAVKNWDVLSSRDRVAYQDRSFATFRMAGRLR